jgi:tight adherence protein B
MPIVGADVWVLVAAMSAGTSVWLRGRPMPGPGIRSAGHVARGRAAQALARVRRRREPPIAELLGALAAELSAGQPTHVALAQAGAGLDPQPCPTALRAARVGGDVVEALLFDARAPGAEALRGLAACWAVAEHSGAGLAGAVARLAEGLRTTRHARAQLAAEVAAARSSARVLAGLPLLGLLIGHWIGADPFAWLSATWPGRLVLVVGLGLEVVGIVWLRRIVAAVEDVL